VQPCAAGPSGLIPSSSGQCSIAAMLMHSWISARRHWTSFPMMAGSWESVPRMAARLSCVNHAAAIVSGSGDRDAPHPAAGVPAYVLAQLDRKSVVGSHFRHSASNNSGELFFTWLIARPSGRSCRTSFAGLIVSGQTRLKTEK
jgi:hypothetical protein